MTIQKKQPKIDCWLIDPDFRIVKHCNLIPDEETIREWLQCESYKEVDLVWPVHTKLIVRDDASELPAFRFMKLDETIRGRALVISTDADKDEPINTLLRGKDILSLISFLTNNTDNSKKHG